MIRPGFNVAMAVVVVLASPAALGNGGVQAPSRRTPSGLLPTARQIQLAAEAERKKLQLERERLEQQRKQLELLRAEVLERLEQLEKARKQKDVKVAKPEPKPKKKEEPEPLELADLSGPEGRKRLEQMAKGLSGMKPQKAAVTLAKLPVPLAVKLLLAMDERKAGKVLGAMEPETAAGLVSAVLTGGRNVVKRASGKRK